MTFHKLTQGLALSMLFGASSVFASSDDALLDLLVKKGILNASEASNVASELKEEKSGLAVSAKGKETVKLRFNGRVQAQYDSLDMEDAGVDKPSTNHFYFRRLFLGAKASLANGMYAETVLDFAGDGSPELNFDKALVGYKFNKGLHAKLGFTKVPFGFEETSSSSKLPTIERSAANRFLADDIDFSARHAGLHFSGDLSGGFSYAAAIVNGAQGEGSRLGGASNSSNDMAAFGRIQWESDRLLLGIDAGTQKNNGTEYRGETLSLDDVKAYTGYINYKINGLDLLGEYFAADLGSHGDMSAYALRASYKINKFEPVIRYSHVSSDEFDIDSDELIRRAPSGGSVAGTDNEIDSYYIGFNYYVSPAVTFMAGYEMAEADNDTVVETEIDGFRARLQLLW